MGSKEKEGIALLLVGTTFLILSLSTYLIGMWGGTVMTVVGLVLILKE